MAVDRYQMSFSTGGLFKNESVTLAALYLELKDWDLVRDKVIAENYLQTRTISTLKRSAREIISRLKTVNDEELHFLIKASSQDQGYLLWVAVCRRYRFIAEFAVEVLHEHYISLKTDLGYEDFDFFFHKKSELHDELEAIKTSTRNKLRQVLFKILREAELVSSSNTIISSTFSSGFIHIMMESGKQEAQYFPVFESNV